MSQKFLYLYRIFVYAFDIIPQNITANPIIKTLSLHLKNRSITVWGDQHHHCCCLFVLKGYTRSSWRTMQYWGLKNEWILYVKEMLQTIELFPWPSINSIAKASSHEFSLDERFSITDLIFTADDVFRFAISS